MDTGFSNAHLYAGCRLTCTLVDRATAKDATVSGTAFVVSDHAATWMVTCRHVVDPSYSDPTRLRFQLDGAKVLLYCTPPGSDAKTLPDVLVEQAIAPDAWHFPADETVDLAAAPITLSTNTAGDFRFGSNVDRTLFATADDFDRNLSVGELLCFPGFPYWHDKNGDRPVLRTGTVVSDPRSDYRQRAGDATRGDGNGQVAFEAFSQSGNSGGPVFVAQRGLPPGDIDIGVPYHRMMFVGVDAGHIPTTMGHSGLSIFYKATKLAELLDSI